MDKKLATIINKLDIPKELKEFLIHNMHKIDKDVLIKTLEIYFDKLEAIDKKYQVQRQELLKLIVTYKINKDYIQERKESDDLLKLI